MDYETTPEVEIAVARWLCGSGRRIVVPNVSWGLLRYEADLLTLTKSGYAWEVEIKISRGDLLRDKKKQFNHNSDKVRLLWFAIPEKLESSIPDIPKRAGVLIVYRSGIVAEMRQPEVNKNARKLTEKEQFQLARLGALRVWGMKKKLLEQAQMNL